jgi:hypothetical protein
MKDFNPRSLGRAYTRDHMHTFDGASPGYVRDSRGQLNAVGKMFDRPYTVPGYYTPDANGNPGKGRFTGPRTYDSAGAFLVGELERLDYTLHEPLVSIKYLRDMPLREDATIADEVTSFTSSAFASASGTGDGNSIGNGKAWAGKSSTQISGVGIDIDKTPHPLRPWALEIKYDLLELESSARVGRPIDEQKYAALKLKHQMDVDEQAYYGDTTTSDTGLVNATGVTFTNVAPGAAGGTAWTTKTPAEILADVNTALQTVWQTAAWDVLPNRVLIPPAQYSYISTQLVSNAGNTSILTYLLDNNIVTSQGAPFEIYPAKWCIGAGAGGTIGTTGTVDRMVVYSKEYDRIRFPMTLLSRTPVQYEGIYLKSTYYGRLGVVEVVYAQTVGYFDGI